jgi:predicted transposase YbfD/YdcC
LRGAHDKGESARTRIMVSAYASRLRLTLASATADKCTELDAALDVLGLIALKGKVVTADALHCNRRTVAAINARGGDWCLALKANQESLLSDARACFGKAKTDQPVAYVEETGHGRKETRTGMVVSAKKLAEHHDFPGLKAFGQIEATREIDGRVTSETRSSRCPGCRRQRFCWKPSVPIGRSKMRCTGSSTCRSAKKQRATGRITVPATSPSCADAARRRAQGHIQGLTLNQAQARGLG